ncbi:MAG: protein tyrosine phosphatase family protein [Pseudomonadota bacterium]
MKNVLLLIVFCGLCLNGFADDHKPRNYISYSPIFASAGQPTEAHLTQLIGAGVQRVVYIAYSDHDGSLAHEDRIVSSLGADFVQIPVRWDAPQLGDYQLFAAVMNAAPDKSTLLHCQANYRASAFAMLYRVIELDVPLSEAKADMNSIWTPDETWTQFILDVLSGAGVNADCDNCDWTPWRPDH